MNRIALLLGLLLASLPLAGAHVYNFEDKHELCQVYGPPHAHQVGDGHAHVHDDAAAAPLHDHDPCKQNRMDYPGYENKKPLSTVSPPLQPIPPTQILFSDGDPSNTEAFVGGEYYQFPIPESQFKKSTGFAVTSDLAAAGFGFPGNGSKDNPYIVEGYLVSGNMLFKNTAKCFVIRNNVVVNRVIISPVIPDPLNITRLANLTPYWESVKENATNLREQYLNLSATWDQLWGTWDANKTSWDSSKATWDQRLADFEAQERAWQDAFARFERDYYNTVIRIEGLASDFEDYSSQYNGPAQPTKVHAPYVDYANRRIADMDNVQPTFETYMPNVRSWVDGNPPPQTPPPGFWGDQQDWDIERENYIAYQETIVIYINNYWNDLMANAPDEVAYQQFQQQFAQFRLDRDAFLVDYNSFLAAYNGFMADYNAFQAEFNAVWADTGSKIAQADAHFAKAAQWVHEYVGQKGTFLFNTLDELLVQALKTLYGIIDPIIDGLPNPLQVQQNTGQLILDWNGQCIHAYNNVVHDLRVNQNNDRTGYATGGIIEDNRFFDIGQIRHYDGIFRENEVGSRAHLYNLIYPTIVASGAFVQSVNNDGANQGWYYDNTIYGEVELDFHGHHHSAGFFAPTSHYHGSTKSVAYMQQTNGQCTATHSTPDASRGNGPWWEYPKDNDIHVLGTPVVNQADPVECLPHQDHGKRWTSVFFNDNVVIDPNGLGLRFEDRNHRADDEQANSENMKELKRPHFHQKWVQMEDNVVVGKIFVDVLNAAGVPLWNDNWAQATAAGGAARTAEAVAHPGAEIVDSHPYRNDAWLDIQRNHVFMTQSTGVLVSDADDMTLFQLKNNRAWAYPKNYNSGMTPFQLLEWLRNAPTKSADQVWTELQGWNGQDRGVQTMVLLSFLRDQFRVEHCGQVARGLDHGFVATDRIFDDGFSIIQACGTSDWGNSSGVAINYTPQPAPAAPCTENARAATHKTDDFYATELALDAIDAANQPTVCGVL